MGAGWQRQRWLAGERGGEPAPRSVQPDAHRVAGAAQYGRYLAVVEFLPEGQGKQFPVRAGQPCERGLDLSLVTGIPGFPPGGRELRTEPAGQLRSAVFAPLMVGEHAPGDAVEPQPCLLSGRDVIEPPPGGQESLSDDVSSVVRVARAAQRVPQDRAAVGAA